MGIDAERSSCIFASLSFDAAKGTILGEVKRPES
jgi:hypothetical protein